MKVYPLSHDVKQGEYQSYHGAGEAYGLIENETCIELIYKRNRKGKVKSIEFDNRLYRFGVVSETEFTTDNSVNYTFDKICPAEKIIDGLAYASIVNNRVVDLKPFDGVRKRIKKDGSIDLWLGEIKGDIFEVDIFEPEFQR